MRKIQIRKEDIVDTDIPKIKESGANPYIAVDHVLAAYSNMEPYYATEAQLTLIFTTGYFITLKSEAAKRLYANGQLGLVKM